LIPTLLVVLCSVVGRCPVVVSRRRGGRECSSPLCSVSVVAVSPRLLLQWSAVSFWLEPSVVFRYPYPKPYLDRLNSSVSAVVSSTLLLLYLSCGPSALETWLCLRLYNCGDTRTDVNRRARISTTLSRLVDSYGSGGCHLACRDTSCCYVATTTFLDPKRSPPRNLPKR
jgi:hypothetical protein